MEKVLYTTGHQFTEQVDGWKQELKKGAQSTRRTRPIVWNYWVKENDAFSFAFLSFAFSFFFFLLLSLLAEPQLDGAKQKEWESAYIVAEVLGTAKNNDFFFSCFW